MISWLCDMLRKRWFSRMDGRTYNGLHFHIPAKFLRGIINVFLIFFANLGSEGITLMLLWSYQVMSILSQEQTLVARESTRSLASYRQLWPLTVKYSTEPTTLNHSIQISQLGATFLSITGVGTMASEHLITDNGSDIHTGIRVVSEMITWGWGRHFPPIPFTHRI